MALRDRREARRGQGGRAARRSNAPDFLRDDDELDDEDMLDGGLLSDLTKRRTRRQYDERQNVDDAAGAEGVSLKSGSDICQLTYFQDEALPMQELSQIKAGSIVEWLATDSVRRSVSKFFKLFLLEMTDEHGDSVYGQRIIQAGSSTCFAIIPLTTHPYAAPSELRVARSLLRRPPPENANSRLVLGPRSC